MKLATFRAILALPFNATVVVPTVLLLLSMQFNIGWCLLWPVNLVLTLAGIALIMLGLVFLIVTIRLFATIGQGALAPWAPPMHLVVQGIYRHVRNPMISGVFGILAGEGLLFGSIVILMWFGIFVVLNLFYIPLVEEKGLLRRFGDEYRRTYNMCRAGSPA